MCLQIFEQFVKTRIKEEYKEKKSKLLLAKEEFRKLLEESKVSPRYGEKYARKGGGGGLEVPLDQGGAFPRTPGALPIQASTPPGSEGGRSERLHAAPGPRPLRSCHCS